MRIALLLPLLALVACAEDVAKGKTQAAVTEPPPAAAAAPAPAGASATAGKELAVDKARSKIGALGAKITDQHDIAFPEFEGKVRIDGETVAGVSFTVQVASLQTSPEKLANHLKGPDFFGVEQHPTATFTSAEVKPAAGGQGDATHEISGDLTLHGVTKRLTFPAKLAVSPTEVTGRAEFAINRQDFGIVYPGKPDDLIKDNVLLTIELVAPRG